MKVSHILIVKTQIIAKWSSNTYIDYHPAIVDWKSFIQWNVSCCDNDTNIVKLMITKIIHIQSPICFSQRSRCVSLQFSSYSSDAVWSCSNGFHETAFLFSVQVVHFEYFLVVKNPKQNTPYWMWTLINWIASPGAWHNFFFRQYYSI